MINKIKDSGSMDIGESARKRADSATQNTPKATDSQNSEQAAARVRNDSVQLTDGADRIRIKSEQLANEDKVDSARVARIQQALEDGTYQIDGQKIASKMLALDQLLAK